MKVFNTILKFASFTLLMVSVANAQPRMSYNPNLDIEKEESLFRYVPMIGTTSATFSGGSGSYSFANRSGTMAGLGVIIGRGILQVETGLNYAERGGTEKFSESYGWNSTRSWEMDFKNKYLEIPLLIRAERQMTQRFSIFAKAGIVYALLQDSEGSFGNTQNYTSYYNYYSSNNLSNTKSYFKDSTVRWAVGAGTAYKINRTLSWVFQADYQESFGDVSNSQPAGYYTTTSMSLSEQTYSINTGLLFDL